MTELTAPYGQTSIPFTLTRKPRKTLGIRVTAAGAVAVSAPLGLPEAEVIRLVVKRGAWIERQRREVAKLPPPLPPRRFISGEGWRYLGRQYRLRVVVGDVEGVRLSRGELWLTVREPARAERVLTRWLRARAEAVFAERMQHCLEHAAAFGLVHSGEFRLRAMRTRWGSLSRSGQMTLNLHLIHAPSECIDFVILHELCHLREFNHSRAYYALLGRVLPDWKRRRERLNRLVELPTVH
ncbi:M48 family metallopeptidase [Deinococcus lacus]|uniref:M48 family metallopeptidase n=1 Tax=Deinococcus lacus TaxID=392561 RepID=A0ABW1YEY0_9DEIO